MPCIVCNKSYHDRRSCPVIFCKQLVYQIFDSILSEYIVEKPMYENDYALAVMMALHPRCGKKSILSRLDTEILRMILGKNTISLYNTSLTVKRPQIECLKKLRNTVSMNIAFPDIDPITNDVYAVCNNKTICSETETIVISKRKSDILLYFKFTDNYLIYIILDVNDISTFFVIDRHTFNSICTIELGDIVILEPVFVNERHLIIFLQDEKLIKNITINEKLNVIIQDITIKAPITSYYYNPELKHVYVLDKDHKLSKFDIEKNIIYMRNEEILEGFGIIKEEYPYIHFIDKSNSITKINVKLQKLDHLLKIFHDTKVYFTPINIEGDKYICVIMRRKVLRFICKDKILWDIHIGSTINTQPFCNADNTYLYITTNESYIYKICIESGIIIWNIKVNGKFLFKPILHKGSLYVQTLKPSNLYKIIA